MARNFDGIKFEALRQRIDAVTNTLHDDLTECYYQFWRQGESKPFFQWDVRATPAASKKQFDLLHAALFHIHAILFHKINLIEGHYAEDEYDAIRDESGAVIGSRAAQSRQWLIDTAVQYGVDLVPIRNHVIAWIKTQLNHDITLD